MKEKRGKEARQGTSEDRMETKGRHDKRQTKSLEAPRKRQL